MSSYEAVTRPNAWVVEQSGARWVVVRADHSEYHKTVPCHYGPNGRVITFRYQDSAWARAGSLNMADRCAS